MPFHIGVDIGGTFTDFVAVDVESGKTSTYKVPTVPSDPAQGVLDGITQLLDIYGIAAADVTYFVHGTTLALNTLIERKGAPTGLIVTRGFRDTLEIARLRLPNPTNFFVTKNAALVPREHVAELDERLLADGSVLREVETDELDVIARSFIEAGVDSVAVCLLHSYRNPENEQLVQAYLNANYPELYITCSHDVWPVQREYERAVVTVINAYVGRRMSSYLDKLVAGVASASVSPPVLTTRSNGGVMGVESARQSPIHALLSGPAAGVVAGRHFAQISGFNRIITLDIGGTSADVAILDGDVSYTTDSVVGGLPVILPTVDMSAIGAGGGSIAKLSPGGTLQVGPESAGSTPGPACYGQGGVEPTVTDACLRAGILNQDRFLGGRLQLDTNLADEALARLSEQMETTTDAAASAVLDVAIANMHAELVPLVALRGLTPADFALCAYGGAGPTLALLLAEDVGIQTVLVPPKSATLSALGAVVADFRHDVVRAVNLPTSRMTDESLATGFKQLEVQAQEWLKAAPTDELRVVHRLDARYWGQSFNLDVIVPGDEGEFPTVAQVVDLFHTKHEQVFGLCDREAPVEIIDISVTLIGETEKYEVRSMAVPNVAPVSVPTGRREVTYHGRRIECDVHDVTERAPGLELTGPLVLEADDTTVFVPPGFDVRIDGQQNLIATAKESA